ncbi:DUF4030 domain-containing protein [Mesobacillus subterraneus]|uniref:DUF4030 domain-containing protein n=1 Tax=Mesobacillus subterraneus TaxID=285983 RepID=A0A427TWI6_9BACI|nr:DUF4030 domain-containing protein [Mesobacillus subterraneus]RSD28819.1 DUF4030 domain-containing protein [Mesobacillus subterraneus]
MKMDDQIKNEIKADLDKIEVPTSLYDFAKNIKTEADPIKKTTGRKRSRKSFHFAAAAIIGFGVLTSSAFLNPSVAEMASKIPYLGQIFKSEPMDVLLWEAMEEEGYKHFALGLRPGETKEISVSIEGSEKDADREREKITMIIDKVMKSKGYDSYKVHVSSYMPEYTPMTVEEKKDEELGIQVDEKLKSLGYEILMVNPFNEKIEVEIPLTEARGEEIRKAALEIAKAAGSEKDVFITDVDVEKNEREGIWTSYLRSIFEGLGMKKEYKVSGYGYSYKDRKMKMFIKTSLKPSDENAKKTVEKIRSEIEDFIEMEKANSLVKNDEYEVIIRDKSGNDFPY